MHCNVHTSVNHPSAHVGDGTMYPFLALARSHSTRHNAHTSMNTHVGDGTM